MDGPQSSDALRFEGVVRCCHPEVLAYARRRVSEEDAQDIVAEVFLAAWRHLEQLPDDPLPWLYRTAYHAVLNSRRRELRARRLRQRISGLRPAANPDHADRVAETGRIRQALAHLPARDQEALRLTTWEDLSISDAATVMGATTAAMKVRLHRARRRLARLLNDADDPITPSEHPATPRHPPAPPSRDHTPSSPAIVTRSP